MKVLIAEDDQGYRAFVKKILQTNLDVSVVAEALDGDEALERAREIKPEVVLVDLDLKGQNGLEVTRRLKTELPGVRVVLLSTTGGEAVRKAAIRYGADAFLRKDAEISQLLLTIRHTAEAA